VKHHIPEDDIIVSEVEKTIPAEETQVDASSDSSVEEKCADERHLVDAKEESPVFKSHESHLIEDLLRSLKGKIGREELIILLVMLLVSSDGFGIEALILALILIAG